MADPHPDADQERAKSDETTRPAKPGDTDTTRFGMEDGDNTDVPATGLDPEQQSPSQDATTSK
ncbi:hypothetical protein HNO88_000260 [Novosphingobium chloroacetimidivorans]|uniref:Uncharacterized protein n=1 Tax=Novosphingobium chloroacetimidivorans TaxID=1428314 RepID=A0A7W7K7D0_9SPHN|nr:hypothetical protein [Novosphingobium chloroacetimidivorans]MBB4856963.1 hypothetical protein [Novosphingobium chloroacetimidivorans]